MQSSNRDFAIILAAGFSTRMGTCKTTLPWRNHQSLLRYQTEQFLQANITPIVVLGSHNADRQADCPLGARVVIKADSQRGKTSTILAGLECLPQNLSTITISAVDQPRSASIYQTLLQAYRQEQALITAPCYLGKLGHPVLFSHRLLPDLKQISDSTLGLRKLIQDWQANIKKVEFAGPEVLIDINDPATYRLLLRTIAENR